MDASFHIKQPQKLIIVPGILYQEQYAVLQNVTFKLLLVTLHIQVDGTKIVEDPMDLSIHHLSQHSVVTEIVILPNTG